MDLELNLDAREAQGKANKRLRRVGIVPGVVYGRGEDSTNVQVDAKVFETLYRAAGRTSVVKLHLPGAKGTTSGFIKSVQRHPLSGQAIHVDYLLVNLTASRWRSTCRSCFTGEAPAVEETGGTLLHNLSSVRVKALPNDIPHEISVDVSGLDTLDAAIHVSDLDVDTEKVQILTDAETLVVGRRAAAGRGRGGAGRRRGRGGRGRRGGCRRGRGRCRVGERRGRRPIRVRGRLRGLTPPTQPPRGIQMASSAAMADSPAPLTVADYEPLARALVDPGAWDYQAGGSGDEHSLADNLAAWARIRLRPRVLVDVAERDLSTAAFGAALAHPIVVAPTAMHRLSHPDAEIASARGTAAAGGAFTLSTVSSAPMEDVAAAAPDCVRWFQLYAPSDRGACRDLVDRAVAAGFSAIVLTADLPTSGQPRA